MKTRYLQRMLIGVGLAMAVATPWASAVDYYVAPGGTGDGTASWANASSNLIGVVAGAGNNDTVYVTNNAKYYLTNQITVSYAITVRSWGPGGILDPTNTIIDACAPGTTNRHFILSNSLATIAGLTLTNGSDKAYTNGPFNTYVSNSASGGSIWLYYGTVTNCIIKNNTSFNLNFGQSGGDYSLTGGGGIYIGRNSGNNGGVWNCTISGNSCIWGSGIYIRTGGPWWIANCTMSGNSGQEGAGIVGTGNTIVSNCWVVSNYASDGGGIYGSPSVYNSFIIGNTAWGWEGGGVRLSGGLLRNCLIANNVGNPGGGVAVPSPYSSIQNCTIVSNYSIVNGVQEGGGLFSRASPVFVENTIIWGNKSGGTYSNWFTTNGVITFTNCCTAPNIFGSTVTETNTITNDPRFVSATDFRLQPGSPCINAGTNKSWMIGMKDLDGLSRIDRFNGQVDIGAYEYLPSGTMFIIH